jgi:predicted Zn-dependent peptidase
LEQPSAVLGLALLSKQYGFPTDYWDSYPTKILAATAEDVQRVARKYLTPEAMQLVAVGDAAKIKPILEKYGRVEVFDSDGRALNAPAS